MVTSEREWTIATTLNQLIWTFNSSECFYLLLEEPAKKSIYGYQKLVMYNLEKVSPISLINKYTYI